MAGQFALKRKRNKLSERDHVVSLHLRIFLEEIGQIVSPCGSCSDVSPSLSSHAWDKAAALTYSKVSMAGDNSQRLYEVSVMPGLLVFGLGPLILVGGLPSQAKQSWR